MRTSSSFLLVLSLLAGACGSSQPDPEQPSGASGGAGAGETEEPIVISPPATSAEGQVASGSDACTTDADCVPSVCCHASACVARASAPDCDGTVCTTDCRSGTLDCGGGCLCRDGHCAARLWQLEAPTVQ